MSNSNGKFVWYELNTTDARGAEAFYCNVIGWTAQDAGNPEMDYTIISAGGADIGGLLQMDREALQEGAQPGWLGYIAVDNVDGYVDRVQRAGGSLYYGPEDIPGGIGRFAVMGDPYGAGFVLFRPGMDSQQLPAQNTPGFVGWHELHAGDGPGAFAFYSGLFGWRQTSTFDMGPMGSYILFGTDGDAIGGMMTKTPGFPQPQWLFYFNVDGADAAAQRTTQNGGRVLMGPQQVPGGSWIIQCQDPQGVMFAAVAPRK
jgi:uncharacterized protein